MRTELAKWLDRRVGHITVHTDTPEARDTNDLYWIRVATDFMNSDLLAEHDRSVAEKARAEILAMFERGILKVD